MFLCLKDISTTMADKMEVAMNGPSLVEADGVIEKAMRAYFKFKRWHFVKTTDIRDCFNKSQVLKRLKGQVSKLPFMKT